MKDRTICEKELVPHTDDRGVLFEVYRRDTDPSDFRQVYYSTSKPGAVRGNHYHRRKTESFCVLKGTADLTLVEVESGNRTTQRLTSDCPKLVSVGPGIAHSIRFIGPEESILLIFVTEEYKRDDPDVYHYLVPPA